MIRAVGRPQTDRRAPVLRHKTDGPFVHHADAGAWVPTDPPLMNLLRPAAVLLAALVLAAGCTPQASAPPASAPPATPTPSPSASVSPEPSPSEAPPSSSPAPTVVWERGSVPATANASSTIGVVPGGDGLIAIGFDGGFGSLLWTSPDGRAWTDVTPDGFQSVGIASVVEHDGRLVGVGRGDTINVDANRAAAFLSDDGLTWHEAEGAAGMEGQLIDVVFTDLGLFAVGGVPGADAAGIWRSTDGSTWERTGGDFEHAFMWAIAEGGPGLVAVGWRRNPDPDLAVWTSADGVSWTLSPDPEGVEGYEATDVIDLDGTLAMVGSSFTGEGGRVWFSDDGLAWDLADVAGGMTGGAYARGLTRIPGGGLVAVGGGGNMQGMAWFSTDGRSWEPLGDPVPNAFFNAAFATDDGLLLTGATQDGTLETGVQAYATVWSATFD